MPHPPADFERYHRQMLLPGMGEEGQKRLAAARALVVGCGALGSMIAGMLARAGVGHLIIVDRDVVDLTNLHRQVLFDEEDVRQGLPKAEAARQKLARINSQVQVTALVEDVNHTNIERIMSAAGGGCVDVIVDGLDNFETRFLVNDAAVKYGVPYVYGGAVGTTGMSLVVLPHTPGTPEGNAAWERTETGNLATPCLRCIFEQAPPPGTGPTCDTVGVLGPAVTAVASFQSIEAIKILTGNWTVVNRRMLSLETWDSSVRMIDVAGACDVDSCPCCKGRQFEYLSGKLGSAASRLCGQDAVQVAPRSTGGRVDFAEVAQRLTGHGQVTVNPFMLRASIVDNGQPLELTLFADGRAIVKGTREPARARGVVAKYVGT